MAAIVYLDVDDEITSAAARIRALDDERIGLVLPLGSRLATSRINFRLLAREAEARGKRIEVVTNDASARALAASAGLPTHVSVAAFEAPPAPPGPPVSPAGPPATADWHHQPAGADDARSAAVGAPPPPPIDDDSPTVAMPVIQRPADRKAAVPQVGRRPPQRRGPVVAAIFLVAALVLAIGTAGFVLLPNAEIVIVPASESVGPLELNVTAQSGVTRPDPVNLLVPATRFTFEVAASNTFPATGVKVTETTATGEVTFSSLDTGNSNTIDSGSIVETESGIEFRTTAEITLPPAEIGIVDNKFVVIPSTEKVGVEAVTIGPSGNVAANTIVVVPKKENAQRTTVTNETATAGGTHTETLQVQGSDIAAALAALDIAMAEEFERQIVDATGVPEGTTLFPETKSLGEATPSVDPATLVGTDAEQFDLGLTAEGTVIGADPGPVESLAQARIRTEVDDGFRLVEESIIVTPGEPIVAGSVITFPVTVEALEVRLVDGDALLGRVRGLGLPQARTILKAYGDVTITVWPDWVTTIPTLEGRATLTIDAAADASPSPGSGPGSSPEASP
ncbi:MAG TPA: baseplate J/gp47 family protein [Candidatus Limnocylindrales bacterium]|nr:baseplate J/gp47 family protein [Candidatus Limnocylindrales bacterium]